MRDTLQAPRSLPQPQPQLLPVPQIGVVVHTAQGVTGAATLENLTQVMQLNRIIYPILWDPENSWLESLVSRGVVYWYALSRGFGLWTIDCICCHIS